MKLADVIRFHLTNGRGWCDGCRKRVGDAADHIASIIEEWSRPPQTPPQSLLRPFRAMSLGERKRLAQIPQPSEQPPGFRSWEE